MLLPIDARAIDGRRGGGDRRDTRHLDYEGADVVLNNLLHGNDLLRKKAGRLRPPLMVPR